MSAIVAQNRITPELQRQLGALRDKQELHQAMAEAAFVSITEHFVRLTQTNRNPYGARATFWPRMIDGTFYRATSAEGQVVMPREVAQRFYGGTIKPTGGRKALTIPVHPNAYGKSARSFTDLDPIPQKTGDVVLGLLVRKGATRSVPEIYYLLLSEVTQDKNPDVLPKRTDLEEAAAQGAGNYMNRFVKK